MTITWRTAALVAALTFWGGAMGVAFLWQAPGFVAKCYAMQGCVWAEPAP